MAADPQLVCTEISDIPNIVRRIRDGFQSHKTLEIPYRIQQLKNLKRLIKENEQRITDALQADLHKCQSESILMESSMVVNEITRAIDELPKWAAPQHYPKDLLNTFNQVYVQPEPYGVVLVIAPWNYPFQLCMLPLVGVIAAGNCCVLKPSESSIATSNLVAELIPKYLDPECYTVVTGGVECSKFILKEKYDYIFYTGSTQVGRIVMKEAAANITPVTLELGGKSPALVAPDANIRVTARRIVWGKCANSGQTCIAPDYVICTRDKRDELIEECKKAITEFYGEDPQTSKDYGRIINAHHFKRLVGLMKGTTGKTVYGGKTDESNCYFSPTLVVDVTTNDVLMKDEIFGPILPFVTAEDVDSAINMINHREKPLALYIFTESSSTFAKINKHTSAGGVCHNDTIMHAGIPSLPFGGVGHSGMGAYHGRFSFNTFSHFKPVMETGTGLEFLNRLRYPPFTTANLNRVQWLLSPPQRSKIPWKLFLLFLFVSVVAGCVQMFGLPGWFYQMRNK